MGCPVAVFVAVVCVALFLILQLIVGTARMGCRDLSTALIYVLACLVPHAVTKQVGDAEPKFLGHPGLKGIYPYMVFIEPVHCSGTIISESWVLSAAHCYENRYKGLLRVYAGLVNSADRSSTQYRAATRVDHPRYRVGERLDSRFYDVALLNTTRPFILNSFVDTIGLAVGSLPHQYVKCKAIGFGLNEDFVTDENALKWLRVMMGGTHYCREFANKYDYPVSLFGKHVVCASTAEESGKSLCSADTGGPLVCGGAQVGVLMAAFRRDKKLNPTCGTYTGIYAYVGHHIDWIESVVTERIVTHQLGYRHTARSLHTEHKEATASSSRQRVSLAVGIIMMSIQRSF